MQVRRVTPGTLTGGLRADLARLLAELDPEGTPRPSNLDALLADATAYLLVAVDDAGACLGMLTLTFRNSLTRRSGHIDHVVADPARRREGVATRLVEDALRIAADEGASRVDLTSGSRRAAAQALYEALGFERRETNNWRRRI